MKPGPKRRPIEDRFWSKVDRGMGCWLWKGSRLKAGYGRLGRGTGRSGILAHRMSWEIHFGPIPKNLEVCHHCDNPACVNPAHLFVGTHAENFKDAASKRRMAHGTRQHRAKLDDVSVVSIRRRAAAGETEIAISKDYGVAPSAIHKVIARKTWKHVA